MPYFITDKSADCSGWAVIKDDGEVIGCHQTKSDAIDQMVAVSLAEGMDPGGERTQVQVKRSLPTGYRPADSEDVPAGRACGNCEHYSDEIATPDGTGIWCDLWEDWVRGDHYCDQWLAEEPEDMEDLSNDPQLDAELSGEETRQVELNVPGYIRDAAARGLELRADGFGGDGLVQRTIREARLMADGQISEDKVVRANAWAQRHAVDLQAGQNSDSEDENWPGAGAVAHYLWGINPLNPGPARDWFARKSEEIQAARSSKDSEMDNAEFRFEAPRDNLVRKVEFRAEPSSDGLTLEGYAAVFNEWTQIDSYEGTFKERIAPGAFKKTISERMPVLQFDHGTHPLIGSIPLGVITSVREDSHGLKVKARLSDNWLVEPVRDAIRDGAIQGMSFRFRVINDKWTRGKDGPERTINEIALYEAGPVVFPAYEQTSVGVRSREVLTSLTDPEVRGEIAKLLAFGTVEAAETTEEVEPQEHSIRTQAQRQAIARLRLQGNINED